MSNTKQQHTPAYTPGNWTANRDNEVYSDTDLDFSLESEGVWVCDCGSHDRSEHNARLIAAAPELLSLLGYMRLQYQYLADLAGQPSSVTDPILEQVDAAIARARGEQA